MILEFRNKTRLNVLCIFGGPANIDGIMRDVLTIKVDPRDASELMLREIFGNSDNLSYLYTYEYDHTEDGIEYGKKIFIGEGYTRLLNVEFVTEDVKPFPGRLIHPTQLDFFVVTVAQMTVSEWFETNYWIEPPEVPNGDSNLVELIEINNDEGMTVSTDVDVAPGYDTTNFSVEIRDRNIMDVAHTTDTYEVSLPANVFDGTGVINDSER